MESLKSLKAIERLVAENQLLFVKAFAPADAIDLDGLWFSSSEVRFCYRVPSGQLVVDVVSMDMFEKWVADIRANSQPDLSGDALTRAAKWLAGDDQGAGAATMLAIAMGKKDVDFGVPRDAHEFGKCFRLVEAVPEIREHFPKIARKVPEFAPILTNWDGLCGVYWPGMTQEEKENFSARLNRLFA